MRVAKTHTGADRATIDEALSAVGAPLAGAGRPLYLAHLQLEHRSDFNALWNFNVGNIMLWRSPDSVSWYELVDGDGVRARYQAHDTLIDGMRDYASEIRRRPSVVAAAERGDVDGFARELVATEYIGTPASDTQEARARRVARDLRSILTGPSPSPGVSSSSMAVLVGLVVGLGSLVIAKVWS